MGLDAHMIHTCTIQRPSASLDSLGDDVPAWADLAVGERCRLVIKDQRVPASEMAERPVITTYTLFVGPRAGIRQGDRVVNVVYEDGTVEAGPFRADSILPRRARSVRHVTVRLERIK